MNKNVKITVSAVCFIIMIVMIIWMINEKDVLFQNNVEITYPDRCVEKYVNTELITEECTEGRRLMEEQNKAKPFMPELPWDNLTYNGTI